MAYTYRWNSPHEWLLDTILDADKAELRGIIQNLITKLDADEIQDLFESQMEGDLYFDPFELI